jgi:hypothetical protein
MTTSSEEKKLKVLKEKAFFSIHEQSLRVIDIIQAYSNVDGPNVETPLEGYKLIDNATDSMVNIWSEYYSSLDALKQKHDNDEENNSNFRKNYVDMIAEALADEIDDLRCGRVKQTLSKKRKKSNSNVEIDSLQQQNILIPETNETMERLKDSDVEVLASCLDSGIESWSSEERRLLIAQRSCTEDTSAIDRDSLTIHERKRMLLFGD